MGERYDLPDGVGRPNPFLRTLLVWGLPLLAWILLIIGWLAFADGCDGGGAAEPAATPTAQAPAPDPAPAAPTPTPQPAAQAAQPGGQPAQPTAKPLPQGRDGAYPNQPYDFAGAVSHIGLPQENGCSTGILVDPATRKVLWAKNADRAVPIASMTKMMTLLLAEEAIAAGKVTRDTPIKVTEAAYAIGGAQVWLDPRETFPLKELLKTIAIKSANDSAYLVGEYLGGGSMPAFVQAMNDRAKALGMAHTTFYDAHGLGDGAKRDNRSSAHDMAILAERLLGYPEVMRLASTRLDTFRDGKLMLKNHNNLITNRVPGVDGLKTGYTSRAGFCVTFTCKRGGRRLIGCVTGYKTHRDRDAFCKALLDWGYEQ